MFPVAPLVAEEWLLCMDLLLQLPILCFQEYQHGNKNVVIQDTEMKQTVYIYKCENSTIHVKGKVNAITLGESVGCDLLGDEGEYHPQLPVVRVRFGSFP